MLGGQSMGWTEMKSIKWTEVAAYLVLKVMTSIPKLKANK